MPLEGSVTLPLRHPSFWSRAPSPALCTCKAITQEAAGAWGFPVGVNKGSGITPEPEPKLRHLSAASSRDDSQMLRLNTGKALGNCLRGLPYLGLSSILSWSSMLSRMVYLVFFLILVLFRLKWTKKKVHSDSQGGRWDPGFKTRGGH